MPRSAPNALISTNASIEQWVISPPFDFTVAVPDSVSFFVRRSSSHLARLVVEASTDGGSAYTVPVGDTLRNTGATSYVRTALQIPAVLIGQSGVMLRWRIVPDGSGSTATLRIDDVSVTAHGAFDLALTGLSVFPASPFSGEPVVASAVARNVCQRPAGAFTVYFSIDANRDSIPQPEERMASSAAPAGLAPGDSLVLSADLDSLPRGQSLLTAELSCSEDQNGDNNLVRLRVGTGPRAGAVILNEIMYAPAGSEPEWVELHNVTSDTLWLLHWAVSDNNVSSRHSIRDSGALISPHGFIVLTKDTSAFLDVHPSVSGSVIPVPGFPTLNNGGDAVVLYDDRMVIMDSMAYSPAWGGATGGKSLERIDPFASARAEENWGTSRSLSGSTPGAQNSLAQKENDLCLDTVCFHPEMPCAGEPLLLEVRITNIGRSAVPGFRVCLFEETGDDTVFVMEQHIGTVVVAVQLHAAEATTVVHTVMSARAGRHRYRVIVEYPMDEDTTNNFARLQVSVGYPPGVVRLNELMYGPRSGFPEWIELANVADDTVNISGWKVGNRHSQRYTIATPQCLLAPHDYVLVTKDTALLREAYGLSQTRLTQIPTLPTFLWNNISDAVVLADDRGRTMDSVFYSSTWGGTGGKSLERRDLAEAPGDSTNWASSEDSLECTPGRANSVVVLDADLLLCRVTVADSLHPDIPTLDVLVINAGRYPSQPFSLALYDDVDGDSIATVIELVCRRDIPGGISPHDSLHVTVVWDGALPGLHQAILVLECRADLRLSNNVLRARIPVAADPHAIVINEIMYDPLRGCPEYVELLNVSERDVDLSGWLLADDSGGHTTSDLLVNSAAHLKVFPGEFLVITSDSALWVCFPYPRSTEKEPRLTLLHHTLSLNNGGDRVVLKDATGRTIDSVSYLAAWHNPGLEEPAGRSLEKIRPAGNSNDRRNWSSSAARMGGTPGRSNSIFVQDPVSGTRVSISPNPFSPDGDGIEDFTVIHYEMPFEVLMLTVRVFDVRGRLIRYLVNNEPSGARGDVVWDGCDDAQQRARIGPYIIVLDAADAQGGPSETARGIVVLATPL